MNIARIYIICVKLFNDVSYPIIVKICDYDYAISTVE